MAKARFEWDRTKDRENQDKHGVSFAKAQVAFADPNRVIAEDLSHSSSEKRHYCFGLVKGDVLTVRFTHRHNIIRIFGAGYWRKGRRIYERENQVHERASWRPQSRS
ncbi:MAG: BrnT family toxin [Nitrospirae bacterium]|nr:BrnT family toxin [Nitrospirota bacterium]